MDVTPSSVLYLVDISGYLFRSFYALPPMSNPSGQPVQAIFGLARSLINLKNDFQAEYVLAVFDGLKGKERRKALYNEYKAHRIKTPDELISQMPLARELCDKLGIGVLYDECYEADDLIAAAVKGALQKGMSCCICSSDKDLLQLVNGSVWELHTHKNNYKIGRDQVKQTLGIEPEQIVDWLALCGDSADNIPGVAGIGPKTAVDLLNKYGSLEGIISHLHELGEKRRQNFDVGMARLSYELARLHEVEGYQFDLDASQWTIPQENVWLPWFERMGFRSLIQGLRKLQKSSPTFCTSQNNVSMDAGDEVTSVVIDKQTQQLDLFYDFIPTTTPACVDTNKIICKGWDALAAHLKHIQDKTPIFIDVIKNSNEGYILGFYLQDQLFIVVDPSENRADFRTLENILERCCLSAYNSQLLMRRWLELGMSCNFSWNFDLRLMAHLYFADSRDISIASLSNHFDLLGFTALEEIDIGLARIDLDNPSLDSAQVQGLKMRANMLCKLGFLLKEAMDPGISKLYEDIERPLARVLARMEYAGIGVSCSVLSRLAAELHHEINRLLQIIYELAGEKFNMNSPKQLAKILYEKLQLRVIKQGKTGASTDAGVLEELKSEHAIIAEILHYRELEKLRSTYVEALPSFVNPKTGSIHPYFEQAATSTGRLACHSPNLQNIPVRSPEGLKIREAFQPRSPDRVFVGADYSQIELRLMAHLSGDPVLIEAFKQGQDIHRYTAALVFEIDLDKVSDEQRFLAKAVNFGIMYGQQAFGLARQLGIPVSQAASFITAYFTRYKGVAEYIQQCKNEAKEKGFVTTILGRRRQIPEMRSSKAMVRQLGERLSVNTPLQGGQADIIKLAMIRLDKKLKFHDAQMILQIHDELIFECPSSQVTHFNDVIRREMEGVYPLKVPLVVNIAVGKNWKEC